MAIINRSLDSSEQQWLAFQNLNVTVTGKSDAVVQVPQAGTIISTKLAGVGLSGTPTAQMAIRRFVTGAGQTLIPVGPALTVLASSTSGPQSYSYSLTVNLLAGDTVCVTHGGTNAGLEQLNASMVIQAVQDIKTWTF
jgi:hypothetical protein